MFKKSICIVLLSLSVVGCKKDPTNVANLEQYSSGSYPSSLKDLLSVLGATYANYRSEQLSGFQLMCKTLSGTDHSADLCYGGQGSWTDMVYNNLNSSNALVHDTWRGLYVGVKNANATLDRADFYEAHNMRAAELKEVNFIRGEAYFLRAFYYFNLACFFGESYITTAGGGDKMGVPIFTEVAKSLEETQKPRSTVRETWDQIISDLKKSADLLKGVQWTTNYRGRATDWSAKALLGKAYVFTQDWTNAKTTLKDVIDNSGKSLMSFSKYKEAFNSKPENEFNEESLFEINVDRVGADYGIFGPAGNQNLTTTQGVIWAPSALDDQGVGGFSMGYSNEYVHDKNLLRFGFNLPTYTRADLVDNPAFNPAWGENLGNIKKILSPAYRQQSMDMRTNKTVDPRLYINALQPWIDVVHMWGSFRPVAKCVNIPNNGDNYHGWSFKKFQTIDANVHDYNASDGSNLYIVRLADVYLLYAEACMNSGENTTALEYINKVHRRAYDLPVNTPSATYDYGSLTAATKAAVTDVNLANNPLRYERYAELFTEGHWWFDVCRWRIGGAEAVYFGNLLPDNHPSLWNDNRSYCFPIPLSEINTNTQLAGKQNPGY